jgi:orotidine-5'-phosphate decarboxylase
MRDYLTRFPRRVDIVSPGTRFWDGDAHDQQQVEAPGATVANGADFLVIGRMVTAAKNPKEAMERLKREIKEAEGSRAAVET